jgi:glycosyl hydrolase family 64 (putative beta-1,3-glucanase)
MRFAQGGRIGVLWVALAAAAFYMLLAPAAQALQFEIVNESGKSDDEVFVTVVANGAYDVPGVVEDEPVKLSEIAGGSMTINQLISGRVYISYGAGVQEGVPFDSPTRFDWAEMTVTPVAEDVANLTAVDQFAIGMRLDTLNASADILETVGAANSETIFAALQEIPGGPQATIRDGNGDILRVLSPLHSTAYPDLGDYVRSMAGETITLRTAFFGTPFTTTHYSGTFAADGSIALRGTTNPLGAAPPEIAIPAADLIEDVYTGGNTPNDVEGAIRRDLLSAFSAGFWNGRYGNDALSFCNDPIIEAQGSYCPHGFNQPAFGDARAALSPFPTCEQYAAVINQHSDVYGNPYSDASKKVAVALDQPGSGGEVTKLRLTIQPDSGNAQPSSGGNPDCGAAGPAKPPAGSKPSTAPGESGVATPAKAKFRKRSTLTGEGFRLGRVVCPGGCAKVVAAAKLGGRTVARGRWRGAASNLVLTMKLTKAGKQVLSGKKEEWSLKIGAQATGVDGTNTQLQGGLDLKAAAK